MDIQVGTIGIIIPMYNAQDTIRRAVQSVFNQTYTDWHIYIINDNSTDGSLQQVQQYCADMRITLLDNKINRGAAETRNVGLLHASENFIAFLDSDDEWASDKLMLQAAALAAGDNVIVGDYAFQSGSKSYQVQYGKPLLTLEEFVKKQFRICFSSVCYRQPQRKVFFRKKGHEDFLFLYELFRQHRQIRVIDKSLVTYYQTGGSLSRDKNRAAKWHMNLLRLMFARRPLKVYYYFFWYMLNGMLFTLTHR